MAFDQLGKLPALRCAGFAEHGAKPATGQGVALRRQVHLALAPGHLAVDFDLVEVSLVFAVALLDDLEVPKAGF